MAMMKSWQCKSRAFEDVYHPHPKILSAGCRKSVESIKELVDIPKPKPRPRKPKPKPKPPLEKHPSSKYPSSTTKPEFEAVGIQLRLFLSYVSAHVLQIKGKKVCCKARNQERKSIYASRFHCDKLTLDCFTS